MARIYFFFPIPLLLPAVLSPHTGARTDVMNKCMSCLHGAEHDAFPPRVKHFDSRFPSSPSRTTIFTPSLQELGPDFTPPERQPITNTPRSPPHHLLGRKSIGYVCASPCPMRRKRRDVISAREGRLRYFEDTFHIINLKTVSNHKV